MNWKTSDVMGEFLKIAEKQDMLGLRKNANINESSDDGAVTASVKNAMSEKNPYQEDEKTIREKRLKSPEKSILEIAHPEPVFVAESLGDGALVENEIEQQQKAIDIINKIPTGSLVGRYASAINQMVKLAEVCDALGHTEAADLLTDAASNTIGNLKKTFFK